MDFTNLHLSFYLFKFFCSDSCVNLIINKNTSFFKTQYISVIYIRLITLAAACPLVFVSLKILYFCFVKPMLFSCTANQSVAKPQNMTCPWREWVSVVSHDARL